MIYKWFSKVIWVDKEKYAGHEMYVTCIAYICERQSAERCCAPFDSDGLPIKIGKVGLRNLLPLRELI
jgi:hypothetical protein